MSKRGAEGILNARREAAAREREEAETQARAEAAASMDDRARDRANDQWYERGSRIGGGVKAVGGGVGAATNATPRTSLADPSLAIWLYTAVVGTAILFSSGWVKVRTAIVAGFHK